MKELKMKNVGAGRAVIIEVGSCQAGLLAEQHGRYVFYSAIKELARLDQSRFATVRAAERAVREHLCKLNSHARTGGLGQEGRFEQAPMLGK